MTRIHIWTGVAAVMLAGWLPTAGAAVLTVKPLVAARGETVILSEMVQDPDSLPSGWGERGVIKAPAPGRSQQVQLATVAYALQKYSDMSDVTLRGATKIAVERQGRVIESAELQAAVKSYIADKGLWDGADTRVEFDPAATVTTLPGDLRIQVLSHEPTPADNRYVFRADIAVDGQAQKTALISARILSMQEVWVATRALPRGHVIGPDDIRAREMPVDVAGKMIPETQTIVGMEVERAVTAEQPVLRTLIREPVCAQRGELIQVIARKGGLEVSVKAKAMTTGRRGDQIACMNQASKRQLLVKLVGDKQAVLADM